MLSEPKETRMRPIHAMLALGAVFVWGTNFVIIKWALSQFPPLLLCTLRFGLTAIPAVLFLKRPAVRWRELTILGLLMGPGQFGFLYFAMNRYITPGLASLLIQAQVFITIGFSVARGSSRVTGTQIVAFAAAAAGIALIAWQSTSNPTASVTWIGVFLVLMAAFCWAVGNIVIQSIGAVAVLSLLAWSSLMALPFLVVLTLLVEGSSAMWRSLGSADSAAWGAVVWQVVGNTFFGFGAWNWLLVRYDATAVAPAGLLVPVFGMGASAWLLSEGLPLWKICAAALVIGGLVLNVYSTRRRHAHVPR